MLKAIECKLELHEDSKPLLMHLFQGQYEEDFVGKKLATFNSSVRGSAYSHSEA
jgi:hypothetical protein